MNTRYDPKAVEQKWYEFWESRGYFKPESDRDPDTAKPPYCITIPPPNVTGSLHIGHSLCYTIQDVLTRWKRMQGFNTLCLPGTDHAGIATQMVVEKTLRAQGISRHELGREKFVERVWEWKKEFGDTIIRQFRRMGFSFEWDRLKFTMDPEYAGAVMRLFVDWYEAGHIYVGSRVGNWCPNCHTVISDIEVDDKEINGKLYHIRYPFADGDGYLIVATTRPETMLGDVAVAVNPADERYTRSIGRELILPLVGRAIPLIADEHPDPEFGTGAVKVTPAHDPNDFEIGRRHGLEMPAILNENATINTKDLVELLGPNEYLQRYNGMDRYAARKAVLADLEALAAVEKIEDHKMTAGACARCHTVLEPMLSEQWYCSMADLAKPAAQAVREGRVRFVPERFADLYLRWMDGIRDWPLSRQLWWGHQIPAWYCRACRPEDFGPDGTLIKRHAPIVSLDAPANCPTCGGTELERDPWVLDTWFSSALWPHVTLGWPAESGDLKRFYPTSVLVTAKDIIYLWVSRMVMTGLFHMDDIPFHDVYIYATVLNEQGQRMSKSLGTGIDPLEVIDKYGADALRFALLQQTGANQEIRFGEKRIEEGRNFTNKIWNASRFVLMNLEDFDYKGAPDEGDLEMVDRWILSRLHATVETVTDALERYNMAEASKPLQEFFWGDLCDWYVEIAKTRLEDTALAEMTRGVLVYVMDVYMRLLHPFMPHISEEVYQRLPGHGEAACIAAWPAVGKRHKDAERDMEALMEVVRGARNLRAEVSLSAMQSAPILYVASDNDAIMAGTWLIASQAWFSAVERGPAPAGEKGVAASVAGADLFLPIAGVIDVGAEIERVSKELDKASGELAAILARLENPMFIERAKPEAVEKARADKDALAEKVTKLEDRLTELRA